MNNSKKFVSNDIVFFFFDIKMNFYIFTFEYFGNTKYRETSNKIEVRRVIWNFWALRCDATEVNLVKNQYKIPIKNSFHLHYHTDKTYKNTKESTIISLLLAFVCCKIVGNSLTSQFQDHGHAREIKDEDTN